jgi:hypothetical protein
MAVAPPVGYTEERAVVVARRVIVDEPALWWPLSSVGVASGAACATGVGAVVRLITVAQAGLNSRRAPLSAVRVPRSRDDARAVLRCPP